MASDKQLSKSIFLLSHFVNVEAKTITLLSEQFPQKKSFTQFYRVAKVRQTQDTRK
jgi:hypothetical protein